MGDRREGRGGRGEHIGVHAMMMMMMMMMT